MLLKFQVLYRLMLSKCLHQQDSVRKISRHIGSQIFYIIGFYSQIIRFLLSESQHKQNFAFKIKDQQDSALKISTPIELYSQNFKTNRILLKKLINFCSLNANTSMILLFTFLHKQASVLKISTQKSFFSQNFNTKKLLLSTFQNKKASAINISTQKSFCPQNFNTKKLLLSTFQHKKASALKLSTRKVFCSQNSNSSRILCLICLHDQTSAFKLSRHHDISEAKR